MKKASSLIITLFIAFSINASTIIPPVTNPLASEVMVPLFNSGKTISLLDFMTLKPAGYKKITGKKMSWKERISLKIFQRHFKSTINKDGTVNLKKLEEKKDDMFTFRLTWFLLGFFFFYIPLIIALFIKDDKRHERIKWTLKGFLIALILGLILIFLIVLSLPKR